MIWEFAKGNQTQSKRIAQDLGIPRETVIKYRKIYRDILMQYNLTHTVDLGDDLVFDETMVAGFKKKRNGRSHGPNTWSFIVSNKKAGDRRVRTYNTQVRNGATLCPFFLDATNSKSDHMRS